MSSFLVLIGVAAVAGVATCLQGQFMATLNRSVGTMSSVFINYGVGMVCATVLWLARRGPIVAARPIPPYAFGSGALGLVIVGGISYAAPRLGLSRTLVITVAAQLSAALLIDHFGLLSATPRSIDPGRALGLALAVAGAWLIVRP